jgi:hypothetical protein
METKEKNENEMVFLEPIIQKYTFAKRFRGDDAKEVYNAVAGRISKDFKNAPAFNGYFKFNEEKQEINGSDLYHGILINDELKASGLHLPSVIEGKSLDAAKKLTNGVYRDYGLVVYDGQNPNSEIAQRLIKEANKKGLKFPILAPFSVLKLRKGGSKNGVSVLFNEETNKIMSGEEAQKYLAEQFNYKGNSGVRGLDRGGRDFWFANWDGLGDSGGAGRVDWVCGEATAQNLERAVLEEINKVSRSEMEKLNIKIANSKEAALKVLRS